MKNIALIGFMGSGKTTIGMRLAKELKLRFVDADLFLTEESGKSISELFKEEGEEGFRKRETAVLKKVIQSKEPYLLSTGGGVVTVKENEALLRENHIVLYLSVKERTVLKRLEKDESRPLLAEGEKEEKIRSLLEARRSTYLRFADVVIETDEKTVEEIFLEAIEKLKLVKNLSDSSKND